MKRRQWLIRFPVLIFLTACVPVSNLSDKIETPHYALYRQKVLFVQSVESRKVTFANPAHTRYYYLRGRNYAQKWIAGDTFIIADNLEAFYNLKFVKPNASFPHRKQ